MIATKKPTFAKTYTVLYNPDRIGWEEQAWTQVKVTAVTYHEARHLADMQAKLIGRRHGFYSWRTYDRNPLGWTSKHIKRVN